MRRFSQKNALVTLSDINVTPLLDLAFVLLIIFVITTPLLEQSVKLELPRGGQPDDPKLKREDVKTVEITPEGRYVMDGNELTLEQVERALVLEHGRNPDLVVAVRGDRRAYLESLLQLLDRCQRNGITRILPRMAPER
jgi:biopolymer transport protein ExbD